MPDVISDVSAQLFVSDNLRVLKGFPDEFVDLVYMDPPFNTLSTRSAVDERGTINEFQDRFGDIEDYLAWLLPRIKESLRVLRSGGAIFVHCDWRTSHYLKVALDSLLGYQSFVNEIIWKRHNSHSDAAQGSRHFGRTVDSILFYGKGERATWNPQFTPYDPAYVRRVYRHSDADGRKYALTDLTGPGGSLKGNPEFEFLGVRRAWRYSQARMRKLHEGDRVVVSVRGGVPRQKRYLDDMRGRQVQTVWDDVVRLPKKERVGYPTQKPIALLDRIIRSSTQPGDLVLDPFCGSGTALVAAALTGRRFVGIDSSPAAVAIAARRLRHVSDADPITASLDRQSIPQEL